MFAPNRGAQESLSGLRPLLSPASSRNSAVPTSYGKLSGNDLSTAPGRHQPELSGAPKEDRGRYRAALFPPAPAAARRSGPCASLSPGIGHRRTLLHTPPRIRHYFLRSEEPPHLRRGARSFGSRAGVVFSSSGGQRP